MAQKDWKFTEEQKPLVNAGKLCPACLKSNIQCVGHNYDGLRMNYAYNCLNCGEQWEGD